jgi:hypothetical protein
MANQIYQVNIVIDALSEKIARMEEVVQMMTDANKKQALLIITLNEKIAAKADWVPRVPVEGEDDGEATS